MVDQEFKAERARVQRCGQDCEDDARKLMTENTEAAAQKAQSAFHQCMERSCVPKAMDRLPELEKRLEKNLGDLEKRLFR